ncbi:ras-related protein Rab-17 isoform X4 [Bos taurus]|uniref:Ras-related protein Rab-17 n=2 Tax=Bos TaxID=9903 RepID=A0AAA9SBC3_BOVIN|nr:ras-related protein Rab-17 isoform X4 [Bos taurus]
MSCPLPGGGPLALRKRRTWEAGTGLRLGWGQSQKDGRTASRTSPDKGTKTCLCAAEREQRRGRQGHHAQVCSCAFFTKVVDLGAACLKFEIWDTAGQEKYHSVCRLYFRGANAALLVYDITRKDSFCKAQQWLKDLEEEFHPGEVVVMLVGNKTDLEEEREVTFEEGKEFAESKGLLFMETSAKRNYQVADVFNAVARELSRREESKEGQRQRRDAPLTLSERPSWRGRCCAH